VSYAGITPYVQSLQYDSNVSKLQPISIRLSPATLRMLDKISAKTGIDRTNVIRLAITRLAENEGLLPPPSQR